ncbi:hypothetical protein MTO96_006194 [Rhipicephalus appendiculatus]
MLSTSMGIYWFSVVFGFTLHLCVEAPVSHLEKFLFESDFEKSKTSAEVKPSAVENGNNGRSYSNRLVVRGNKPFFFLIKTA